MWNRLSCWKKIHADNAEPNVSNSIKWMHHHLQIHIRPHGMGSWHRILQRTETLN